MAEVLYIDFETCGPDLKKFGASKYSKSPELIVTIAAWAFGEGEVKSVVNLSDERLELPDEIIEHVLGGGIVSGWNSGGFEYNILKNHFELPIQPWQITDTMQRALHAGLPGALGMCGPALKLPIVKDTSAHKLMMQMAKPRIIKKTGEVRYWHIDDPEKRERLRRYCEDDVRAEREIAKHIPELPEREKRIAALDRAANERGVLLDTRLIETMIRRADEITEKLNARCAKVTKGAVTSPGTQAARLAKWLTDKGLPVDSLSKGHVNDALQRVEELARSPEAEAQKRKAIIRAFLAARTPGGTGALLAAKRARPYADLQEALKLRQLAAKSSVKKLHAMLACKEDDDCARGLLAYYGANRTGRWCLAEGSLVRVLTEQGIETDKPIESVLLSDLVWDGIEWVRHEGVVFSGEKDVIEHDGVIATPEHVVFLDDSIKVTLGEAKRRGLKIWRGY